MIPFNTPYLSSGEIEYVTDSITSKQLSGNNRYTHKCESFLEQTFKIKKVLLTTSCTHALEMAALLINTLPGDEIIMPSYTFVSTANAFALRGAKIIFIDINPETMNIDESKIEDAITDKTKAIVPVHYAGIACEMDTIMSIAKKHQLYVIEDAAQCIDAYYKGKALGTIGDIGCLSFHESKNIHCGEGGALLLNQEKFIHSAEIIREKGTNRTEFMQGNADKYSWKSIGSSYLMNDISAAFLLAQLKNYDIVTKKRLILWNTYHDRLITLPQIQIPQINNTTQFNAHIFFIKVKEVQLRDPLIHYLREHNIHAVFHYIPLHTSDAGMKYGIFHKSDIYTTKESERLIRLPLYYDMTAEDIKYVTDKIFDFFQ